MSSVKIGISEALGGGLTGSQKIVLPHRYKDIISLENLLLAWQEFIRGKREKVDVQEFGRYFMDNIIALHEDLANKSYVHGGYESFSICDPKPRHIHKASVRDRLLHHAIYRVLYPFFDRAFITDSFSCRNEKGTHKALNRFRAMAYKVSRNHTRTCWVLKCDIKKFFASVDHAMLTHILREYITDQDILWLLQKVIESFTAVDYRLRGNDNRRIGLPLGNLTSQLFANVYMNELDQFVKHRLKVRYYIRYADDFAILHEDRQWLENQIPRIGQFLQEQLQLCLHPDKVSIKTFASGVDYLGWVHFPDHRVLRGATKRRMVRRLNVHPTSETLQSYLGLVKHGNAFKVKRAALLNYWLYSEPV